jgi:hypothetical protein
VARGGHGLPKGSPVPARPDPSTPCGQATPKTALRLFLGWPARRAGSLWPSSTLLDTQRRTPMERGREKREGEKGTGTGNPERGWGKEAGEVGGQKDGGKMKAQG